ncbi:hypothetical protein HPB50_025171 [Hyalomma asiaticum]|uniref:Uncharacterized protein n=1 Tax=Hyalomma asiaticum TaxID=266040 RepID=A0ACB7SCA2_HYAAI|nr:hypothetical protein HPB50_025171 [Hyalomma asiaticum]
MLRPPSIHLGAATLWRQERPRAHPAVYASRLRACGVFPHGFICDSPALLTRDEGVGQGAGKRPADVIGERAPARDVHSSFAVAVCAGAGKREGAMLRRTTELDLER